MNHILGLVGSPRKGGNTEQLMERVLAAAREAGAETKLFTVAGRTIAPCTACDACLNNPDEFCAIEDAMAELYPLMEWADAIVFGSPVYMGTMTAQLKAVFDRSRPLWRKPGGLLQKAAAAVVVGEGQGRGHDVRHRLSFRGYKKPAQSLDSGPPGETMGLE